MYRVFLKVLIGKYYFSNLDAAKLLRLHGENNASIDLDLSEHCCCWQCCLRNKILVKLLLKQNQEVSYYSKRETL